MFTQKEITTRIDSISRRSKTLRNDVHEVLCHIAGHVLEHGDFTAIPKLLDATTGMNQKLIADWCNRFAYVNVRTKNGSFIAHIDKSAREAEEESAEVVVARLLASTPWFELKAENQADTPIDIAKLMFNLAKKIEKARNDGREIVYNTADVINAENALHEQIGSIATTLTDLSAEQIENRTH